MVNFSGQVQICVFIHVYVIEESPFFAATRVLLDLLPALGLLLVRHWATCQWFCASCWRLSLQSPSALQTKELVARRPPVRLQAYSYSKKRSRFSGGGRTTTVSKACAGLAGPAYASSQPYYPPLKQGTVLVSGSNIEAAHRDVQKSCEFLEKVVPLRASVRQHFWDCMSSPFWVSCDCHVEYPKYGVRYF